MPYHWPADTDFALWELDVLDRDCPVCGRMMYICDHRYRRFHTLEGPVELVCKLNHCPDPRCPGHAKTKSPELEITIAPPKLGDRLGCLLLDRPSTVFAPLVDSPDPIRTPGRLRRSSSRQTPSSKYIRRYQVMLAARQQDPEVLRRQYESVEEIILSIDGLQPEKGHETLYVVRELTQKRVWFAEPLISATADEVRRLITKAKEWAESLGKPVGLWMSDKQDAFVTGIAAEFPGRAASLLRQPFPPRRGQARLGGRQSRQGSDAEEGARPAENRTSRAQAAESRDDGKTSRPDDPEATVTVIAGAANAPSPEADSGERRGARLLRGGARHSQ